jgi:RHS repeat-associated protein
VDGALQGAAYTNAQNATPNVSFTYDPVYQRIASRVDGTGTTNYAYNPITATATLGAGSLLSIDGPLANDTITYGYDQLGRATSRAIDGVSASVTLDALGRMTGATNPLGAFTYNYVNLTGRLSSVALPNGQSTTFNYTAAAQDLRLEEIKNLTPTSSVLSKFNYAYRPDGLLKTWKQQADNATPQEYTYGYDANGQLTVANLQDTSTGALLQRYGYTYDASGNRVSEQVGNVVKTFAYNNLNQMTGTSSGGSMYVAGSLNEPATLSVAGNPVTVAANNTFSTFTPVTTGTNNIQLIAKDYANNSRTNNLQVVVGSTSPASMNYDLNGNMLTDGQGKTFAYDAEDRLIKITYTGNATTEFTYDGGGRRTKIVEKNSGGTVTSTKQFVFVGGAVAEERNASNTVLKRFYAQGIHVPGATAPADKLFYTRDHLSSTREITDGTGALRARYDYQPYGKTTKISGDLDADYQFHGMYFHATSGLYLSLTRPYSPDLGIWLQRDPIKEAGGLNLYKFCNGNPINFTDPSGLISIIQVATVAAVIFVPGVAEAMMLALLIEIILEYSATLLPCKAGSFVNENKEIISTAIVLGITLGAGAGIAGDAANAEGSAARAVANGADDAAAAVNSGRLAGSGPAAGVLEVSPLMKSTKAFQNYNPGSSVEFVFDAGSNRFVVGRAAGAGSPHQNLAATISGEGSSVVGGMFQRGSNGQILTNEFSGHYWQNWTPQIRAQFQGFMESTTGQGIIHTP